MVLENESSHIVGTFTFEDVKISFSSDVIKAAFSNPTDQVDYALKNTGSNISSIDGNYLVFKKLAIDPSLQKTGLGRKLYDFAEEYGRNKNYKGMVLETIIEAKWLYEWYINCLLYTSPSPRDQRGSRMPSSA